MVIKQGDVYWAKLEKSGYPHPQVVVQDHVTNHNSTNMIVVCGITTNLNRSSLPGNVLLEMGEANLPKQSVVVVSQVSTIEKTILGDYIGTLTQQRINQIVAGMQFLQRITERRETEDNFVKLKNDHK
jgi:mRNA interferase MazF